MGRLWLHGERLLEDLPGHLDCPMFVDGRIAFLSDHEGVGNLYSTLPDGTDLRRTPTTTRSTPATRRPTDDGSSTSARETSGWSTRSRPARCRASCRYGSAARAPGGAPTRSRPPTTSIRSPSTPRAAPAPSPYAAACTGSPTATAPPARSPTPGVRVRLPEMLGSGGKVAYVTDADGEDAIEIAYLPRASGPAAAAARLQAAGEVHELIADPDGERLALTTHDGRLLILTVPDDAPDDATSEVPGAEPAEPVAADVTEDVTELIRSVNGPVTDLAFSPTATGSPGPTPESAARCARSRWRGSPTVRSSTSPTAASRTRIRSSPGTADISPFFPGADSTPCTTCTPATSPSRWAAAPISYRCRRRRPRRSRCPRTAGRPRADSTRWRPSCPTAPRPSGAPPRPKAPGEGR